MGTSDDYVRSRRSPGRSTHPSTARKAVVVDILSGKKTRNEIQLRPAHSGESPCGSCEHFSYPGQTESACSKVAGKVNEQDTCDLQTTRPGLFSGVQSQGENNDDH